tara:strand:+ start:1329 stop:2375 length:1047 start_codon:yes stop_codon:yes gene_type:complete
VANLILDHFKQLLLEAFAASVTDVHMRAGSAIRVRIGGDLRQDSRFSFDTSQLHKIVNELVTEEDRKRLVKYKTTEGMFEVSERMKCRYKFSFDRGQIYLICRLLPGKIRTWENLNIPQLALQFLNKKQGLILISGPLNSGKTSTMASFAAYLNKYRREHIIFIDEIIEHKLRSDKSIVNLRQLGSDTRSYTTALKYALREDPDTIIIGEINSAESAEIAINIAETGHLVIAGVSTIGSLNTMMRVLNCFPANQLENARLKLSSYLIGVISQVLVPSLDRTTMVPLFEVMTITSSVQNNIRGERMNQLQAEFSRSVKGVSITFEDYAREQKAKGLISNDNYLNRIFWD